MSTIRNLIRKPMENYKGLHCGCAPGTHAALVRMICSHVNPCPGVLDIGTHAGALLLRLKDTGFTECVGTDLDRTRFTLPEVEFKRLDLNYPFSQEFKRKFRLITSTDVIEHLDSPRNFLTEARELLEKDGYLALSFPNVAFWEGRCKFLIKGELWGFGKKNYRVQHHISPITFEQLELMMQEIGFEIIDRGTAGSFATAIRRAISFPIWGPLRLIGGRSVLGECAIFLAKKTEPNLNLKVGLDYQDRWKRSLSNSM